MSVPEKARRSAEQAVEIARRLGDDALLVRSLGMLACRLLLRRPARGGAPLRPRGFRPGAPARRRRPSRGSLAPAPLVPASAGPGRSGQLYAEALTCTRRSGDRFIAYVLRNNAGCMALDLSDVPAARAHLDQAREIGREIGSDAHHVDVNLGWVNREEGDSQTAASLFGAALRASRRHGDRSGTAYAWLGLACTAVDQGDWRRGAPSSWATQTPIAT